MNRLLRYFYILIAILLGMYTPAQARTVKFSTGSDHKIASRYSYKIISSPCKKELISYAHARHYSSEKPTHHIFDTLVEVEEEDEVNNHRKLSDYHKYSTRYKAVNFTVQGLKTSGVFSSYRHFAFVSYSRCISFGVFRI